MKEVLFVKRFFALLTALTLLISSAALAEETGVAVTGVQWDGMTVGRCVAPAGFSVVYNVECCTARQSLGNPLFLNITAVSPEQDVTMTYLSDVDYIEILSATLGGSPYKTHVDGQIEDTTMTPMLRCMAPSAYCDYVAVNTLPGVELIVDAEADLSSRQPALQKAANEKYALYQAQTAGLGLTIDGLSVMVGERLYRFNYNGAAYYMSVATGVEAVQMSFGMNMGFGYAQETDVTWAVPATYVLVCPAEKYDGYYPAFTLFMENTSASDQFFRANQRLSNEIRESVLAARDLTGSSIYGKRVIQEEAGSGDDYDDERFSDYIFDQNDYTLSDGSHIKVSTAYDHVYEGDDGNVYVSDGAFAQPGGSTELRPNR